MRAVNVYQGLTLPETRLSFASMAVIAHSACRRAAAAGGLAQALRRRRYETVYAHARAEDAEYASASS